jgi:hypothetical protein
LFQTDIERALLLLSILKYMADDCDHESIVVEDSIRSSFFNYLDTQAGSVVFKGIFDQWAQNMALISDKKKVGQLKCALFETFLAWIKLRLPDPVFQNLVNECPSLMQLIFASLSQEEDDTLQEAVNVVIELISLSRRDEFVSIRNYVLGNIDSLQSQVVLVLQEGDAEKADMFSEVFAELALSHINQIVDQGSPIVQILL